MSEVEFLEDSPNFFDTFDEWYAELIDRACPDIVIAIARGAVRMLQLRGVLTEESQPQIYSHYSLPFLHDDEIRGKRVLLFDDSVIYGSTMDRVSTDLTGRGAIVIHSSFVADKTYFGQMPEENSPHLWLNPITRTLLPEDDVRRHHATLVQNAFHEGLDFNLDFPMISIHLESLESNEIPYLATLLKKTSSFQDFFNVTYPASHYSKVQRWTALHGRPTGPVSSENVRTSENSKSRITFVPEKREIRLKPVVQYAIRHNTSCDAITFADKDIDDLWRRLQIRTLDGRCFSNESCIRLLTFFGAILLGLEVSRDLSEALQDHASITHVVFDRSEAELVFGKRIASELCTIWDDLQASPAPAKSREGSQEGVAFPTAGAILRQRILDILPHYPEWRPEQTDTAIEMVGKTLLLIQEATDSRVVRRKSTDDRLRVGMHVDAFKTFLTEDMTLSVTSRQISLAIDHCVDRGLAVAKIIHEGNWWLRAFYSGEDTKDQVNFQLSKILVETAKPASAHRIRPFEMQKICATLSYLYSFFPVEVGPDNFGMTCHVEKEDLIHVLTKGSNPAFIKQQEKNHIVLLPNEAYKPVVKPTWSHVNTYIFYEGFKHLRTLFAALRKTDPDAILLLSTCGTADRAFQAIAFELHGWCGSLGASNDTPSFSGVMQSAITDLSSQDTIQPDTLPRIYWSIIRVGEARKKFRIWRHFETPKAAIYDVLSQNQELDRWWKARELDGLMSRTISSIQDSAFQTLTILENQASLLTLYVIRLLLTSGAIRRHQIEAEWDRRGLHWNEDVQADLATYFDESASTSTVARRYNDYCQRNSGHHGIELFHRLPEQPLPARVSHDRQWYITALTKAQECFTEVGDAVVKHFPRVRANNDRIRFSVGDYRASTGAGGTQEPKDKVFILVIRPANIDADDFSKNVVPKLVSKAHELQDGERKVRSLWVDDSINENVSAFIACCGHFAPLKKIMECCIDIESTLSLDDTSRIVQLLGFGSVVIGTAADKKIQIRDQLRHCTIQVALDISSQVCNAAPFDRRERIIAVTEEAWGQLVHSVGGMVSKGPIEFFDNEGAVVERGPTTLAVQLVDIKAAFIFNSKDRDIVEQIRRWINDRGMPISIDSSELLGGGVWSEGIPVMLERADSIVCFIGEHGLGPIQGDEIAFCKRIGRRLIPSLLPRGPDPADVYRLHVSLSGYGICDLRTLTDQSSVSQLVDAILSAHSNEVGSKLVGE